MAATLEYSVGLEVAKALTALRNFQAAMTQTVPAVNALRGAIQGVERTASSGGGLMTMASGLKSMLVPLAGVAGAFEGLRFVTDQFRESISQAADFEQLKVGFTVLLQSGVKAKAMLADLAKFADTTPMQMPELAKAARTLLAFGEPANSVMKDLRQLGDIAAGVQAPIGEIAELFGKARTEGTLFSIDIRELTRRGIPIIGELAKQFHVSENAIHSMAEAGRIKFADLQTALGNLTSRGGMFFGMLTAQGQTFGGMVTTMKDALGALYREFGTPVLEPLKSGVGAITAILAGWKDKAREWGETLRNVLKGAMAVIQNGDAGTALVATLRLGFAEAVNVLYKGAAATVAALITGLGEAVNALFKGLSSGGVWKTIADGLNYAGGKFAATIMRALADAFANIPILGMDRVARGLNTGANQANKDANLSMEAAKKDLENTDVRSTFKTAAAAANVPLDVFKRTYHNTPDQIDTADDKSTLAGVINRANARNNPLPSYIDTGSGAEYGPGAPYGSLDSQMPKPGTKPLASSLGAGLAEMIRGALPASEPDPGEGTIGGRPAASVLGVRPLTLPGPLRPLTMPTSNINTRAQNFINGSGVQRDPNTERTAKNTEATTAAINRLIDLVTRKQPTGAAF